MMKLRRSTILLILLAALLGGATYFYEAVIVPRREEAEEEKKQLFPFEVGDIASLQVTTQESTLKLVPGDAAANDWTMTVLERSPSSPSSVPAPDAPTAPDVVKTPEEIPLNEPLPASEAAVSLLISQLIGSKSDRTLPVSDPSKELANYGLDSPTATVEVTLRNQQTRKLMLGNPDFSGNLVYARTEPTAADAESQILLVPANLLDTLQRPPSEWRESQTPEAQTPEASEPLPPLDAPPIAPIPGQPEATETPAEEAIPSETTPTPEVPDGSPEGS